MIDPPLKHLKQLKNKNTHAYSSTINTMQSTKLVLKLVDLGLTTLICYSIWILDFLVNILQVMRLGNKLSDLIRAVYKSAL